MKVKLEFVRYLECLKSTQDGRPHYVAAGSGLVYHEQKFYVVADDECDLACFTKNAMEKGVFIKLFSDSLPLEAKLRKKEKPDLECLIKLDDQRLLALPSGSKDNRVRGALFDVEKHLVQDLDLSRTFQFLQQNVSELNIEGAVLQEDNIYLFQRGNGALNKNSMIVLKLNEFLNGDIQNLKILPIDLGQIKQTPYSFTDATLGPNGDIYFLAAAEKSQSTYDDGEFVGAIIGSLNYLGEIIFIKDLEIEAKPEGIAFDEHGSFFIITDEDDIKKASILYKGKL
jgi:hypothetical protein